MFNAGEVVAKLKLDIKDYQQGIDESKEELLNFSDTTKNVAKFAVGAFASIATAIGGVVVASANMAMEQEKNLGKLQAQTGATKEEMEEFKEVADNLFVGGRGSYEEIYDALSIVKRTLGETGSEAEKTAENALLLSEIYDYDVAESIRAVDSAQKAWGTSSEETFDMITTLSQQAGDKADDLLDTFWEYAPVLADAGYSALDFGDILASGMENGAFNFDKIGDALKEFNVRLSDGSTETEELSHRLFGSAEASDEFFASIASGEMTAGQSLGMITRKLAEIEDPVERNTLGVAYFGSMWEDLGETAVLAMGDFEGVMEDYEGATKRAGEALDDNLGVKIESIKNQFIVWSKSIGEGLMPRLHEMADYVISKMPEILAVLENLTTMFLDGIDSVIKAGRGIYGFIDRNKYAIGLLAGAIAGVLLPSLAGWLLHTSILKGKALVGLITSTLKTAVANYKLGLSYIGLHKNALLAMGVFGALVAVGILLYKNWDTVTAKLAEFGITTESVSAFVENLKNRAVALWESFKGAGILDSVSGYISGLIEKFIGLANGIKEVITSGDLTPLLDSIQAILPMIFGLFLGGIPKMVYMGYNMLNAVASGMGISVPELIAKIMEIVAMVLETIVEMLPMVLQMGVEILTAIIEGLVTALPIIIETITTIINLLAETVVDLLPMIVEVGIGLLQSLIEGILAVLPELIGNIVGIIIALAGAIIGMLPTIIALGIDIIMALIGGFISVLPEIISAGIRILVALISGIVSVIPQLISAGIQLLFSLVKVLIQNAPQLFSAGVELLWALIKGIFSMVGAVISAMGDVGSGIWETLKGIDLLQVGKDLIRGLWNGIGSMKDWILGKVGGFMDSVVGGIKGFFGIHSPSRLFDKEIGVMLIRGLNNGIERMKDLPVKSMTGIAEDVTGAFDNLGNISVAPPNLSAVSSGYLDVSSAVEVADGSGTGTNYNAPIVQVDNMNVRNDDDIRQVSRELFNLQRAHDRSQGGR